MKTNKSVQKKSNKPSRFGWVFSVLIVICLIAAGLWLMHSGQSQAATESDSGAQTKSVSVVVTNPMNRNFEQVITTQGNIQAKNIAMVSPRIKGTLEEIFVDEGDPVIANQTKLFQTDAVKIRESVTISEHDLAVVRCAQKQAEANLEKVTVDYEKAELDFKRYERLLEKDATTQDIFEQQRSRYKQLAAAQKVAQAQVELVAEQVRQAEAALAIALKNLTDCTVVSPIDGVISMRMAEPGESGSPEVPVFRIEDVNLVEVSAFLPAAIYQDVETGRTMMRIQVAGINLGDHIISYKSPTIHPKLRTFEVKCLLQDPPSGVAPGAMADIAVILASREALGVPAVSVQQRGGQSVVFVVENNIAVLKNIQTGLENDGWIEMLDDSVTESMQVVSMGQDMLNNGSVVSVQKEAE